jgi:hypothetical protein
VIWLQGATGAVAWLALAHALSRPVPGKWPSRVAFGLVLGLALTIGVHGWDFIVRSESLSNSFLALTLAALLNALRHAARRNWRRAGAWSAGCVGLGRVRGRRARYECVCGGRIRAARGVGRVVRAA